MRALIATAAFAAVMFPAKAADVWSATCTNVGSVQYMQTIGGEGFLHLGNPDGSFTSIKLKQSYFDGKVVCGATTAKPGPKEIGGICADNDAQKIRLIYGLQITSHIKPGAVASYCDAQVTIIKNGG
jgi:hypothetical protein